MNDTTELVREVQSNGMVDVLNKSEIDMQIATAHKYPRSITQFRTDVMDMVTMDEGIAAECIYALPRGGKVIEGPSARLAEIVISAWGNSRAGTRIVDDRGNFIVAQAVFHDLQKNVAITYEVQRRITNKQGVRFNDDMITTTANAACSIALRNAVFKGVPKAYWSAMYEAARKTVAGDVKTLPTRRASAFERFAIYGVTKETILEFFGFKGEEDIGSEQLLILQGMFTAIKDGDLTPEGAFLVPLAQQGAVDVPQPRSKSAQPPVATPTAKRETPVAPPESVPTVSAETPQVTTKADVKAKTTVSQPQKANGDGEVLASAGEKALATAKLEVISMKAESAMELLGIEGDFATITSTDVKKVIEFADKERADMADNSGSLV